MTELVITKDRWGFLVSLVVDDLYARVGIEAEYEDQSISQNELDLIESVLKNNTPFEVCESPHEGIENKPFNVVEK